MTSNNKISIQKLYDEIMPIIKTIAENTIEISTIKENIKDIKKDICSKISIKAFISWLTALSIVIGIIVTVLSVR